MKRILIVDDEPSVLRSLRRALRMEFQVELAASGTEALARLDEFQPDIVISDHSMPGMSGCDLLKEVQRRRSGCRVLLLSGQDLGASVGFEVLLKPWDPQELLQRLQLLARAA